MNPTPIENTQDARVEFARASDLDAMAELLAELFALEGDFHPEREKQLAGLRLVLENPDAGQLFVLRAGNRVGGMANALITVSTAEGKKVVLLEDVIVAKDFRRRRFGRLLVETVCEWAGARGFSRLTLLADKTNESALVFYQSLGFTHSTMRVLRKKLA
ncbi:MAG: GNAT family N-acetyltransferase [Candidatus Accumulibacter sp.]|jgi:GNAT superfamily N-acetyltransferase|nr:GNAT family N-acetyltransferase [Accumulibacter sp.]